MTKNPDVLVKMIEFSLEDKEKHLMTLWSTHLSESDPAYRYREDVCNCINYAIREDEELDAKSVY